MRLLALSSLFSLLIMAGYSQSIKVGPMVEAEFVQFEPYIRGEDKQNIYVADFYYEDLIVESFDKATLRQNYRKTFELDIKETARYKLELESFLFLDGYFIYLISGNYYRDSYSELYVHRINASTGVKEPIDTILHQKGGEGDAGTGYYRIHTSKNKTRLIVHYISPNEELERYYEKLVLLDSEMNTIIEKEYVKSDKDELISFNKIIDDEGSIYYLEGNEFVFLDYYQDYEEWREPLPNDIFESNARPSRINGGFNNKGNLVVTAMYLTEDAENTDENKPYMERLQGDHQLEGIVYFEIDGFNKEIIKAKVSKFDQAFIDEFLTENMIKDEMEAEVNNLFNSFSFKFLDDATVLIGESVPNSAKPDERLFNDMVVFVFNEDGSLRWGHRIHKSQLWNNGNKTTSYFSFSDEGNIYVLFQDYDRNFEGNKREQYNLRLADKAKYVIPVLYRFDKVTGENDYEVRRNWNSGKELKLNPNFADQSEPGDPIYVFIKYREDYRLARINTKTDK
ncbi:MAG: hypothetical protein RLP14_05625 [Owenweeksia sp.]